MASSATLRIFATHPAVPPIAGAASPSWPSRLLERAWERRLATRPPLDPAALLAVARTRTRLSDFGDPAIWADSLDRLAHGLEHDARLSPLGRTIAHGQLAAHLADRLRAYALWQRHPEILERPLRPPLIVLGQMRSGTTRMQRLLACDPRFAFTRFHESWRPVPRARLDDRPLRAALALFVARRLNPGFDAIHATSPMAPDEEIGLFGVSLYGAGFEAQWRVPGFAAHGETMDAIPVYREFRRLVQTLAWARGDRADRPWILKVPQFTQDLPALLAAFPGARLICLDRDPAALVASSAALVHNQMSVQSDAVDARWIGREWLRKVALRRRRTVTARALADVPQIDVTFTAMNEDWEGEMARIYAWLGLPLGKTVRARMARGLTQWNRRGARPRYALADYGLGAHDLEAAGFPAVATPSSSSTRDLERTE